MLSGLNGPDLKPVNIKQANAKMLKAIMMNLD